MLPFLWKRGERMNRTSQERPKRRGRRRRAAVALCVSACVGFMAAWGMAMRAGEHPSAPSLAAALQASSADQAPLQGITASAARAADPAAKPTENKGKLRRQLPAYDYAVVWLSDTQYYSQSYPRIFRQMTRWITDHERDLDIRYVIHTGDIVNRDQESSQWRRASDSLAVLERAAMPYGVLAGNHDVNTVQPSYVQFSRYFGEKRFQQQPTYGESYLNNRGHYDLLQAGKQKLIFVYMGWDIGERELQWMEDVLTRHPDYRAILCLHNYMSVAGERSAAGELVYERIVAHHPNVAAVLCGHEHNAELLVNYLDDDRDGIRDRTVYQLLADYQNGRLGGEGYMRLLLFDEQSGQLHVRTYSPLTGEFNFYKGALAAKDEFSLLWPISKAE